MGADPFRIRDHVSAFDDIVADIVRRSEVTRHTIRMAADLAYGDGASENLDLFFPSNGDSGLPVHMFIHGGYWRMFSKRDYSYIAETVTRAGAIAVIIDYALMPSVRMNKLVDQVRRAAKWVMDNIADYGGDPGQFTVSGHSAGAHLATFLFNGSPSSSVNAALLLGGLYDLAPLQSSFLKSEIAITDEEVDSCSPLHQRHDPETKVAVLVGEDETPPFHEQANAFSELLKRQGLAVSRRTLSNRNHMDSVRDLGIPDTSAGDCLAELIARRGR